MTPPIKGGGRSRKVSSLEERFWRYVEPGDEGECWLWKGGTNGRYGHMAAGRGNRQGNRAILYAHRVSYEIHFGCSIPAGMWVDHLCENPLCVNPLHLEAVTPLENALRSRETAFGRRLTNPVG
jgi:hypothetical protein